MYDNAQLEQHITAIAEKANRRAMCYGMKPFSYRVCFARPAAENIAYAIHCYVENGKYHYRYAGQGKSEEVHFITDLLEEITYYALYVHFGGLGAEYAQKMQGGYEYGEKYRRLSNSFLLELYELAGKKVRQIAEADLRDRLEHKPYYDNKPAYGHPHGLREPKTMGRILHSAGWSFGKTFVRFPEQKTVEILSDGKVIGEYHAGHRDSRGMTIRAHYHLAERPEHRYEVIEE